MTWKSPPHLWELWTMTCSSTHNIWCLGSRKRWHVLQDLKISQLSNAPIFGSLQTICRSSNKLLMLFPGGLSYCNNLRLNMASEISDRGLGFKSLYLHLFPLPKNFSACIDFHPSTCKPQQPWELGEREGWRAQHTFWVFSIGKTFQRIAYLQL